MRAVLDPNVLVSAVIFERGVPAEIVRRWEGGEFELVVSAEILFELSEVLRRPRFRRYLTEAEALDYVLRLHDGAAEVSEELPKDVVRGITRDPDDDYIAGVAYQGGADVIVSGDKDLLDLPDRVIKDAMGGVPLVVVDTSVVIAHLTAAFEDTPNGRILRACGTGSLRVALSGAALKELPLGRRTPRPQRADSQRFPRLQGRDRPVEPRYSLASR